MNGSASRYLAFRWQGKIVYVALNVRTVG